MEVPVDRQNGDSVGQGIGRDQEIEGLDREALARESEPEIASVFPQAGGLWQLVARKKKRDGPAALGGGCEPTT